MKYLFTVIIAFAALLSAAQNAPDTTVTPAPRPVDSAAQARALAAKAYADTVRQAFVQDSLRTRRIQDSVRRADFAAFMRMVDSSRYNRHPFLRFTHPVRRLTEVRQWEGKEGLFYGIVALVLLLGLLRNAYGRYLADLFRTYFRTTIRQRIGKEQVANAPLPSLLFNIQFFLAGAFVAVLLLQHYGYGTGVPFWQLFLYCLAGLSGIYVVKFLVLQLFGWLLQARAATNIYIFVVFATNKILGILLLPFALGLAFTTGNLYEVFFAGCLLLLGGLYFYRFYLSFVSIQRLVSINLFHFLLYLVAMEVVPLLLINKLLVGFFAQTS